MGLENLLRITDNIKASTSAKRQKVKSRNSPLSWRKLWEDALREYYPESVVMYSDRAANNLKRAINHRGLPLEDMPTFIPWVVENWTQLRAYVFSYNPKVPRGPDAPCMDTVIRFIVQVHAHYRRTKPEIAAILPLAQRLNNGLQAAVSSPAIPLQPKPRPLPAANVAPLRGIPIARNAPYRIDYAKAEETRVRLGLKKWD